MPVPNSASDGVGSGLCSVIGALIPVVIILWSSNVFVQGNLNDWYQKANHANWQLYPSLNFCRSLSRGEYAPGDSVTLIMYSLLFD